MADAEGGLFSQAYICIIRSPKLDKKLATELSSTIEKHGGEAVIHQSPNPIPSILEFTHIVTVTIDFPGYEAACDALIPVVKPQWVDACVSKNRLANPRQYNPDPRLFLNDVVVSCIEIPEGDKDAIAGGVLGMGGLYAPRITNSTTHLVALSMDADQCQAATSKIPHLKIVLPHWFDDCLKLGKRIDEKPYLFPNPEILTADYDQPIQPVENTEIRGASTPEPKNIDSLEDVRRELDVFSGKNVMISSDLNVGERFLQCLESLVVKGGGSIAYSVESADIYICRYREGDDYKAASRAGIDVGNLSWLFFLITHNTWISPLRRLLHYPICRTGIPGFEGFKISLSNYAGESRIYLENLIAAAGAECTKTLKQENTHLITAHGNSEKCNAAKEWNLHVVNHLWLEESYAHWGMKSVSDPRYSHFPRRTNLGEVVGQTKIDKYAIEQEFFPGDGSILQEHVRDRDDSSNDEDVEEQIVMQPKDNNVPARAAPKTAAPKKARKQVSASATPQSVKPTAKRDRLSLQTPVVARVLAENKENDAPSTTGSRKSKDIAAARLHEIAPDISLYEREKRRSGGVIYGGRRKSEDQVVVSRKRSVEADESTDVEAKKPKKIRGPPTMVVLLTGFQRWLQKIHMEDAERRQLRDLGIAITQDASQCTHLAAPSILKTHKFVSALAYAPKIINSSFITECIEQDKLLDPEKYTLKDKAFEKKYNFTLDKALKRARENDHKLFSGHTIFCVDSIHGGFEAFSSIITANGGQCAMYRGRPITLTNRRGKEPQGPHKDEVFLISGVNPNHAKVWPKFRAMAQDAKKVPRIVRSEWILETAMSQEWRWRDEFLLTEKDL